jgi:hypothetical protein
LDDIDASLALYNHQMMMTGGVVTGPTYTSDTTTQVCNGAVLYPTWSQLQTYVQHGHMNFVSQSYSYDPQGDGSGLQNATVENNSTMLDRETCGSLGDFSSHDIPYAWSMFAYPNNKFDQTLQNHVETCFAAFRQYGEGNNTQSTVNSGVSCDTSYNDTTQVNCPYRAKVWSIDGGACANAASLCYDSNTANQYTRVGPDSDPSSPEGKLLAMPGGNWRVYQFYKFVDGCYPAVPDGSACSVGKNAQQTVNVTDTGSNFALTYKGQTTSSLSGSATAAEVQTALAALSTVGSGNVSVTGSSPTYTVQFAGLTLISQMCKGTDSCANATDSVSTFQWDCSSTDDTLHWVNVTELYCWSDFQAFLSWIGANSVSQKILALTPDDVLQSPSFKPINPTAWGTNVDEVQWVHRSSRSPTSGHYTLTNYGAPGASGCIGFQNCTTQDLNWNNTAYDIQNQMSNWSWEVGFRISGDQWWIAPNLEVSCHDYTATLNTDITNSQTSFTASESAVLRPGPSFTMKVDNEILKVTAISGTGTVTYTVARGQKGTSKESHSSGVTLDSCLGNNGTPVDTWNSGWDLTFTGTEGDTNIDRTSIDNGTLNHSLSITTVTRGGNYIEDGIYP